MKLQKNDPLPGSFLSLHFKKGPRNEVVIHPVVEQAHVANLYGGVPMTMTEIRSILVGSKVTPSSKTSSIELLRMQTVPCPVVRQFTPPPTPKFTRRPNTRFYNI